MNRNRGRSTGPRAQGQPRPAAGARGPAQHQQQQFQAAPPPQQTAWGARARGNGAQAPPAQAPPAQAPPVQQVQRSLQQMQISSAPARDAARPAAGDAARPSPSTSSAEVSRGAKRQGPMPTPKPLLTATGEIRPTQGTSGTVELLKSNYFQFSRMADMTLYQYRVDFLPDPDVTAVKKGLLSVHREELGPAYLFDGTVLWTLQKIDENKERVSTRNKTNEVTRLIFKLTTDLSPSDPSYIQFLNVILRKVLALMDWRMVGRDYFDPSSRIELHEHNMEVWPGYSTSIRQHEDAILLNVELGSKIMRRETAYSLLDACRQRHRGDFRGAFTDAICGTTVVTRYNNRMYKVDDVDWNSSPSTTFLMKGEQVSFKDYYRRKYEIDLRIPDQPLLVSKPSKRDIRAGKTEMLKLVPELCFLTGLDDAMRANFKLMKAIAVHTKVAPQDRVQRIQHNFLRTLTSRPDTAAELNRWNMAFNPNIVEFEGRRLNPEVIVIGDSTKFEAQEKTGDFTQNLTRSNKALLNAPQLNRWVIVYPKKIRDDEIQTFVRTLKKASSSFKFVLAEPRYEAIPDDREASYVQTIETMINAKAEMIMCICMNNREDRYSAIKKKCYVHRSIPNQIVLAKNVNKANMSVCTKIGIQMVCKLGGTPWSVSFPWEGMMFVGFDVCHDTQQREKSFGALVASVNGNHSRYASFVYPHNRGEEICPYIGKLMYKAVMVYMKSNNMKLPTRIIFYRDSVGEGNWHYVQDQEIAQIKAQLRELYGTAPVPIVYVAVSKRINTRLFRKDNSNPLPGTIADSCITAPHLYDFFLVSQSVHEGTVAPTSYVVLADEVNLKPDHLQRLTYKMCHMYYNWSGTVRVPAPVQYAHKLAFLVGKYLHTVPQAAEQSMEDTLYFL